MKYIIFDTETTGLGREDEVIQFSCIIAGDNLATNTFCNFYCYTQHPINSEAFNVHKISKEKLREWSDGKTFEDNWIEYCKLFEGDDVTWIDWSLHGFDQRMINQTLVNNGLAPYFNFERVSDFKLCQKGKHSFNLMGALCKKLGRRSIKLADAAALLPYNNQALNDLYERMIRILMPKMNGVYGFHHADYDAFITYVILYYFFS